MEVGIHEAKTKLSKLIPIVLSGEEVIITKSGHPLVKLVPVQAKSRLRQVGLYQGKLKFRDDFPYLLPEEIIKGFWSAEDDLEIPS
ncbi:MAG: type II toxin-antitoxin system Phd/YefM family antitoxin [Deltaproteobacteria bacterium]|nr:type II toxin-antitoxin system Phd/YefM family antitoxin [Deltaproteobacteria bacterium]